MKTHALISTILLLLGVNFMGFSQNPSIKWWYNTLDFSAGQTAAQDIDGDGKYEVVFGCYRHDSTIYALNAEDGSLLWKFNAAYSSAYQGCNDVAPVIYDVDGDGNPEVIVPSSCNPKTFCFNGSDGSIKWQTNTRGSDSPPTIADIDNDGEMEIIHGEFNGWVICMDAKTGAVEWEILVDPNSWVQTAPTIVDLDNDGQLDFVVATWNFNYLDSIFAYRGDDQTLLWAVPVHDHVYHGSAVADLDQDGKPEIVIGSYNDTLYCLNGEDGSVHWKFAGSGYIGAPASIADLDNDGNCEVVCVHGSVVSALSHTGMAKWNYTIPNYGQAFRGAALADMNGDEYPDVVFGSSKGELIGLHGKTGSEIFNVDLAAHHGNPLFALQHAPVIADFDGDNTLDVFIVGGYGTSTNLPANFGRAYMVSIGQGNGPEWLMFQNDIRRQSSLCEAPPSGISNLLASQEVRVFPNPASQYVQFDIPGNSTNGIQIVVYSSLGAEVFRGVLSPHMALDVENWPNGLYFFQLRTPENTMYSGKWVVTK